MDENPRKRKIDIQVGAFNKSLRSRFALVAKARANVWFTTAIVLAMVGFLSGIIYVADPQIFTAPPPTAKDIAVQEYYDHEPWPDVHLLARKAGTTDPFTHRALKLKTGDKIELRWIVNNIQKCSGIADTLLPAEFFKLNNTTYLYPKAITASQSLRLSCTGEYGSSTDSVDIQVSK